MKKGEGHVPWKALHTAFFLATLSFFRELFIFFFSKIHFHLQHLTLLRALLKRLKHPTNSSSLQ